SPTGEGGLDSLIRQISSRRPVFQKLSWNFVDRDAALDRYSVFDPITNHDAIDIKMRSPRTPFTTGEALSIRLTMSSDCSPPACRRSGVIRQSPPCVGSQFDTTRSHSYAGC